MRRFTVISTLAVLAVVVGISSAAYAATITTTVAGSFSTRSGADGGGFNGANFVYELNFTPGATWSMTATDLLSVTPVSHSLTISGATVPSSNGIFSVPGGVFLNFRPSDGRTGFGNLSDQDTTSFQFFPLNPPINTNVLAPAISLNPPAVLPSAGDILIPDHIGTVQEDANNPLAFAFIGNDSTTYELVSLSQTTVPVPSALLLMGTGLFALIGWRRWSMRTR